MINRAVLVESCLKYLRKQTISKCLYNPFLAVKQSGRISLVGFCNLQCHPSGVVFFYNIP